MRETKAKLDEARKAEEEAIKEAEAAAELRKEAFSALPGSSDLSEPALTELNTLLGLVEGEAATPAVGDEEASTETVDNDA